MHLGENQSRSAVPSCQQNKTDLHCFLERKSLGAKRSLLPDVFSIHHFNFFYFLFFFLKVQRNPKPLKATMLLTNQASHILWRHWRKVWAVPTLPVAFSRLTAQTLNKGPGVIKHTACSAIHLQTKNQACLYDQLL